MGADPLHPSLALPASLPHLGAMSDPTERPADIVITDARKDEGCFKPLVTVLGVEGWSIYRDRQVPIGQTG